MKKMILIVTLMLVSNFCLAEDMLELMLPDFEINLNGQVIENESCEYPLFVYDDITYFPMTWFDSRYLGIETDWKEVYGLNLITSPVTSSYKPIRKTTTKRTLQAEKVTFQVFINGREYNDERYPFLSYKDVTYLPLTWDVAKKFNWTYYWDDLNGLSIESKNRKVSELELPDYASSNGVSYFKGKYYFIKTEDDENIVFSLDEDLRDLQEEYRYKYSTSYGKNTAAGFHKIGEALYLFYHSGGSVMGSDNYVKLTGDRKVFSGYQDLLIHNDDYVIVGYFVPPGPNNLYLNDYDTKLGIDGYIYGWHIIKDGDGRSMSHGGSEKIVEDDLYILASDESRGNDHLNRLYKINLVTKGSELIIDEDISYLSYQDGYIIYQASDLNLYKCDYDGQNKVLFSSRRVEEDQRFAIIQNQLAVKTYVHDPSRYYALYDIEIGDNKYKNVKNYYETEDKLIMIYDQEDYGIVVYDKKGQELLKITDQVDQIYSYEDFLLFANLAGKILKVTY